VAALLAIAVAGIIGGLLFVAVMEGLYSIKAYFEAPFAAVSLGASASLIVLVATDWYFQRQRPACLSAFLGMLTASPIALLIGVGFALYAYYLGAKGLDGQLGAALSAYISFFLTLSVGGWIAIRSMPRT
jgi:hypothetical protein